MQMLRRTDPFDGGDLAELGHPLHLPAARPDHFAVQDDRAGAAHTGAAPNLDPGETHAPQDFGQRVIFGVAGNEPLDAVDHEVPSFELRVPAFLLAGPLLLAACWQPVYLPVPLHE
jgi:hypothetical protein